MNKGLKFMRNAALCGALYYAATVGWVQFLSFANRESYKGEQQITTQAALEETANNLRHSIAPNDKRDIRIRFTPDRATLPGEVVAPGHSYSYKWAGLFYRINISKGQAYPSVVKHELYHVLSGDCDSAQAMGESDFSERIAFPLANVYYYEPKAIYYSYTDKKLN